MPPQYRLSLTNEARDRLICFPLDEQREIARLLELIRVDPSIDGVHKIAYPAPPSIFTGYITSQFWIIYHIVRDHIRVVNIWRVADNGSAYD